MLMLPLASTNYVAVVGAGIVGVVIGMIWYSPMLFGKQWMKATGKTEKDMKGNTSAYLVALIASLLSALVMAQWVGLLSAKTIMDGAVAGFWPWLGFMMPVAAVMASFSGKKEMFWVDAGHHLVVLLIMGAILAVWV